MCRVRETLAIWFLLATVVVSEFLSDSVPPPLPTSQASPLILSSPFLPLPSLFSPLSVSCLSIIF